MTILPHGSVDLSDGLYRIGLNYRERQNDVNKQWGRIREASGVFDAETRTYLVVVDSARSWVLVDWLDPPPSCDVGTGGGMIVSDAKGPQALAAYVAMQVALTNPIRDARANAGTFAYDYLSLPALLEHVAKPRREAGLAIAQEVAGDDASVSVTTYLIHLEGGWLSFGPAVFPAPADPQKRGAVISYARRYALLAALGLAAEDDDAASAALTTGGGSSGKVGQAVGAVAADGGVGGVRGEDSPAPPPDDIQATQRYYHPGKGHKMIVSPHAKGLEICARDGCSFNRRAA